MGSSANATVAWGIDLTDEYGETADEVVDAIDALEEDDYDLHKLFGFTEKCPKFPEHVRELPVPERSEHPDYKAWEAARDAWVDRRDLVGVPVEFDRCGADSYTGKLLVVKRTKISVNWGVTALDPSAQATMQAIHTREVEAVHKVLDKIGWTGSRDLQLLLYAYYG